MAKLPYRTISNSGEIIDVSFDLHDLTVAPKHVALLLSAVMSTLDREITPGQPIANGDVLQALAMALALRTEMLPSAPAVKLALAAELVEMALGALDGATHGRGGVGHA